MEGFKVEGERVKRRRGSAVDEQEGERMRSGDYVVGGVGEKLKEKNDVLAVV